MAVTSTHVNSRLRVLNPAEEVRHTMHRVRPGINSDDVESIMNVIMMIQGAPITDALLTVTTELDEE